MLTFDNQGSVKKTKSAFSTNAQSRFASIVVDGVLGHEPSAAHLTVSLYLCSSGSNAQGELRDLEGPWTETGEFLGGRLEKSIFPMQGH